MTETETKSHASISQTNELTKHQQVYIGFFFLGGGNIDE